MRNVAKIGKIINSMDALREVLVDPHLGATCDPDYEKTIKPLEDRLEILEDHLNRFQLDLIDVLTED